MESFLTNFWYHRKLGKKGNPLRRFVLAERLIRGKTKIYLQNVLITQKADQYVESYITGKTDENWFCSRKTNLSDNGNLPLLNDFCGGYRTQNGGKKVFFEDWRSPVPVSPRTQIVRRRPGGSPSLTKAASEGETLGRRFRISGSRRNWEMVTINVLTSGFELK